MWVFRFSRCTVLMRIQAEIPKSRDLDRREIISFFLVSSGS